MGFIKNAVYNGSVQLVSVLSNVVLIPYITHVLNTGLLGFNSFVLAIANYFSIFGMLGLMLYSPRQIAQIRTDKAGVEQLLAELFTIQLLFMGLSIIGFNIWAIIQKGNLIFLSLYNLFLIATLLDISWLYIGLERFRIIALRNLAIKVLSTGLIFLFVKNDSDFVWLILIQQGGVCLSNLVYFVQLRKLNLSLRLVALPKVVRNHLKPCFILFLPTLASSLYLLMDKVMLGYLSDMDQVAQYDYPNRLIRSLLAILTAFGTAMLPGFSYLYKNAEFSDYKKVLNAFLQSILLLSAPLVCLIYTFTPEIADLFFPSFNERIFILRTISPVLLLAGLSLHIIMVSQSKERNLTRVIWIGAGINLVANFIFIPFYGASGAAAVTLFTELLIQVILLYNIRTFIAFKPMGIFSVKLFLILAIIAFINWSGFIVNRYGLFGLNLLLYCIGYLLFFPSMLKLKERIKLIRK